MSSVEREQFEQGLGNVTWWGFSPARDVVAAVSGKEDGDGEPTNNSVLLLGAGDGRHILHSLQQQRKTKNRNRVHFYVYEQNIMLYARQMLFIA